MIRVTLRGNTSKTMRAGNAALAYDVVLPAIAIDRLDQR